MIQDIIIEPVLHRDLPFLETLQPTGWPDIIPEFRNYVCLAQCYPLKVIHNNRIIGTGATIIHGKTAWLAHIIVSEEHRSHGIGNIIVRELIKVAEKQKVSTCLLIATKMGYPIYLKYGFRKVSEYCFLTKEKTPALPTLPGTCRRARPDQFNEILQLDRYISGEERTATVSQYLKNAIVNIHSEKLTGYFLPDFGEGFIGATTATSGFELLGFSMEKNKRIVVPGENQQGIQFLLDHGYEKSDTFGVRMVLGEDVMWHPGMIYGRAGGNYG